MPAMGRAASKVGLSYTMNAKLRQKKLAKVLPYTDSSVSFLLLTRVTASEDQREIRKTAWWPTRIGNYDKGSEGHPLGVNTATWLNAQSTTWLSTLHSNLRVAACSTISSTNIGLDLAQAI